MTALTDRPNAIPADTDRTVVVRGRAGFRLIRPSRRVSLLARLHGHVLDGRLAAGEAPESTMLLAVRARQLTAPRARRRLADAWDEAAARARRPHSVFDVQVPVARHQLSRAADRVHDVAELLRSQRPLTAQGVAIARQLLTTANSPVYSVRRDGEDLAAAVARAVAAM